MSQIIMMTFLVATISALATHLSPSVDPISLNRSPNYDLGFISAGAEITIQLKINTTTTTLNDFKI